MTRHAFVRALFDEVISNYPRAAWNLGTIASIPIETGQRNTLFSGRLRTSFKLPHEHATFKFWRTVISVCQFIFWGIEVWGKQSRDLLNEMNNYLSNWALL